MRRVNKDLPVLPGLSGYLAILLGCGLTMLMQSSSVVTSTLVPLVGCGAVSVRRMYEVRAGTAARQVGSWVVIETAEGLYAYRCRSRAKYRYLDVSMRR